MPERRGPTGSRVLDRLREGILTGRYAAGSRIRQEELAAEFGTSRLPVREALRMLEAEGLVVLVPNSGAWVAALDLQETIELYKIREVIEPLALTESVPSLTDAKLDELAVRVTAIESCTDSSEYMRLDRLFHLAMYDGERLPRLVGLVEQHWNVTEKYRRAFAFHATAQHWETTNREHRLLLNALSERDAEAASALIRLHIRRTRLTLTEHSDIFRSGK
jgi:DNA-binding GntR family transcriptional regulator